MCLFLPTPVLLGGFLPVGDWLKLVSRELQRLMLDGSAKLAIISPAWTETQEQKHHIGMNILNIHMGSE